MKEQSKAEVVGNLAGLVIRLSELYAIQNYSAQSASILAEWVYENYKFERLELVIKCLQWPPDTGEKIWRLTPDTVTAWMAIEIEKDCAQRERQIHNAKNADAPSEWSDERLKELEEVLKKVDDFVVPALTEDDIIQEGRSEPKKPGYVPPNREYVVLADLRVRYANECTDLHTGKILEGKPSFEEWLKA